MSEDLYHTFKKMHKTKNYLFFVIWKLDIIFKICSALQKIHDAGLIHQDLKFENIFMLNIATPVIGDLGTTMLLSI